MKQFKTLLASCALLMCLCLPSWGYTVSTTAGTGTSLNTVGYIQISHK